MIRLRTSVSKVNVCFVIGENITVGCHWMVIREIKKFQKYCYFWPSSLFDRFDALYDETRMRTIQIHRKSFESTSDSVVVARIKNQVRIIDLFRLYWATIFRVSHVSTKMRWALRKIGLLPIASLHITVCWSECIRVNSL